MSSLSSATRMVPCSVSLQDTLPSWQSLARQNRLGRSHHGKFTTILKGRLVSAVDDNVSRSCVLKNGFLPRNGAFPDAKTKSCHGMNPMKAKFNRKRGQ